MIPRSRLRRCGGFAVAGSCTMIMILNAYERACRETELTEYFGKNNNTQAGLTEIFSLLY